MYSERATQHCNRSPGGADTAFADRTRGLRCGSWLAVYTHSRKQISATSNPFFQFMMHLNDLMINFLITIRIIIYIIILQHT